MNGYAVQAEGLARSFGEVHAVSGIDLAVERGEIYGFLGPNGAGKSTTVRMLTTLLAPSGGRAFVAGNDVMSDSQAVRLKIGAALQEAALDDKQTGREVLVLQGRLYGLSGREIDQRMSELASLIDLGPAIDRLIGTYSGGMKRRLDLAAALVHNPEVLFLDEPTTGLDPISRAKVWEEVARINRELGVTIFLTTQYLEEADELADRVGIISGGRLAAEGTPNDLKRSIGSDVIIVRIADESSDAQQVVGKVHGVEQADLRGNELVVSVSNGAELISEVAIALSQSGVQISEIMLRTPTLDDVFLQVTGERMQSEDSSGEAA